MAEIHHLTYGAMNPVVAYLIAVVGSLLGLVCMRRAGAARHRRRRVRWLALAAITIGGAALWLTHFTAMFGFDVPDSPVRYSFSLTLASLVIALVTAGAGIFVAGRGEVAHPDEVTDPSDDAHRGEITDPSDNAHLGEITDPGDVAHPGEVTDPGESPRPGRTAHPGEVTGGRVVLGGLLVGGGAVATHHTGLAAVRVAGRIEYDGALVGASTLVAVAGATAALWLAARVRGWRGVVAGASVLGLAVCGMHYIGMAAMRVWLWTPGDTRVEGLSPSLLIVPITVLAAVTLVGVALSALQAMTEEEFADDGWPPSPASGRPAPLDAGRPYVAAVGTVPAAVVSSAGRSV